MKVISREEIRVATLAGAVVLLKAGEEREVADEIGHIALQMGAEIVGMSTPTPAPAPAPEPVEETMDQGLVKVLEEIIANGDPKDFKADGAPKAAVINKAVGRTVKPEERTAAWEYVLNA